MRWREDLADNLNLPKDLVLGAAIVTVTGRQEAYVENYISLIEYTQELIRIQTKTCKIDICGKKLDIEYYTNEDMKIIGEISEVKYC